jgi:endonuclease/exonuclease/phosphatase family metal-dependent hydrolase
VENDTCLTALVRHSLLREAGYDYIMTASPDQRGIDVALLYRPDVFRLLEKEIIRVPHRRLGKGPTRDILRVSGRIASGDTLDVFVLHKPSRAGGTKKSDSYRRTTSQLLANAVTRLSSVRSRLHVLVMGDFNDYPSDPSVTSLRKVGLHNLMNDKQGGTYRYRGDWGILDHLLVSEGMLLPDAGIRTSDTHAQILRLPFLLVEDEKYGGDKPFRTYNGMDYLGGFSDHLPVCVDLFYSW